jgi:hypothetical protein
MMRGRTTIVADIATAERELAAIDGKLVIYTISFNRLTNLVKGAPLDDEAWADLEGIGGDRDRLIADYEGKLFYLHQLTQRLERRRDDLARRLQALAREVTQALC